MQKNLSEREIVAIWKDQDIYCGVRGRGPTFHITGINCHRAKNVDSVCHLIPLAPRAQDINFTGSDITEKGFAHLKGHPSLEKVYLDDTELPGSSFEVLTTIPKLRALGCSPRHDTRVALSWIGQLVKLTNLRIADSNVVDADLTELSHLEELTDLQLSNNNVDSGLSVVAQFQKLVWLVLSFTKIRTKTLESVRLAESVQKLFLEGVNIENAGLAEISQMEQLQLVHFVSDQVDANGIRYLSRLKNLEKLSIDNLKVTPDMVAEFKRFARLKQLWMGDVMSDKKTEAALKKELPGCNVDFFQYMKKPGGADNI